MLDEAVYSFVNPYPAAKMSSAKCLVCNYFHGASKLLTICEHVVRVSNSFDLDETTSYSASYPDPSCLHMELWSRSAGLGLRNADYADLSTRVHVLVIGKCHLTW